MTHYRATWGPGEPQDPTPFRLVRRWFWWPADSVTLGNTIYTRRATISAHHLQHEAWHVSQQRLDGRWRFLWRYLTSTHWRATYEGEAKAVEGQDYPKTIEVTP